MAGVTHHVGFEREQAGHRHILLRERRQIGDLEILNHRVQPVVGARVGREEAIDQ